MVFNELCTFDSFWIWKIWNYLSCAAVKVTLFVVINLIYILLHFLFGKILCLWKQLIYMYFTCITRWMLYFFMPMKIAKYLAENYSRWQTAHHSCLLVLYYQDNCWGCWVLACKGIYRATLMCLKCKCSVEISVHKLWALDSLGITDFLHGYFLWIFLMF